MAALELIGVGKRRDDGFVLREIDLAIADGEFVVIVGPSGCGKTTLLRMLAGLETIDAGEFRINGVRSNDIPPERRGLPMVFQSYALYPHMDVAGNLGFSLRMAGRRRAEVAERVAEVAALLRLDPLLRRYPDSLSGGQRQRVAIGRAILCAPKAFLFDEPLSNLDAGLRLQMRIELARLNRRLQATMLYVTHDQMEAMTMAHRIVVLNGGCVEQVGTPLELYRSPANVFVAEFIGASRINLLRGETVLDGRTMSVLLEDGVRIMMPWLAGKASIGEKITIGLRPEHLHLDPAATMCGIVEFIEHLGHEILFAVRCGGTSLMVRADPAAQLRLGESVQVGVMAEHAMAFGADGVALRGP